MPQYLPYHDQKYGLDSKSGGQWGIITVAFGYASNWFRGPTQAICLGKGVDDSKWNLVTGDKKQIYALARKSYLAVKTDGDGGPYDMIHTENFILVDKQRRIRGFYDGTKMEEVEQLMNDLEILKASYQGEE